MEDKNQPNENVENKPQEQEVPVKEEKVEETKKENKQEEVKENKTESVEKPAKKERLNLYTHQYRATPIGLVVGKSASGEGCTRGIVERRPTTAGRHLTQPVWWLSARP